MNFEPGFEWDEDKDRANQAKHGTSFEEVLPIFDGPTLTKIDDRRDYGEIRRITTGMLLPDIVLVVPIRTAAGRFGSFQPAKPVARKGRHFMTISRKRLKEIEAIRDEDIDYSDIPETDAAFWADAEFRMPRPSRVAKCTCNWIRTS